MRLEDLAAGLIVPAEAEPDCRRLLRQDITLSLHAAYRRAPEGWLVEGKRWQWIERLTRRNGRQGGVA